MHKLIAPLCRPVNPEHFLFISSVFALAGHGDIPSPLSEPLPPDSPGGFRFTDIPINRGLLAAVKEARELQMADDEIAATLHRLMIYPFAVQSMQDSQWITPADNVGASLVRECFIRACAVCKFTKNGRQFNLKDLDKHAKRFAELEA